MILNEEQAMVRDMARRFASEQLAPQSAAWDESGEFPRAVIAEMGALGLMGMLVPEEWGGAMTDTIAYACALEEIAAGMARSRPSCRCTILSAACRSCGSEPRRKRTSFCVPWRRAACWVPFA